MGRRVRLATVLALTFVSVARVNAAGTALVSCGYIATIVTSSRPPRRREA